MTSFFSTGFSRTEKVNDLAALSDGRVVAVGEVHYDTPDIDFGIAVWAPNVSDGLDLDPTFNSSGRRLVAFDLPGSTLADTASAVLPDGDGLIVAGRATTSASGNLMAVCRVLLTGGLDSSFGSGGQITLAYQELGGTPFRYNIGLGLTGLVGGGFVLTGYVQEHPAFNTRLALVKFDDAGAIDPSWGALGWHVANYTYPGDPFSGANSYGEDVVGTPDGGVVAVGCIDDPMASGQESRGVVTRLTATGALDTGFNGSGVALYAFEDTSDPSYPTETAFTSLLVLTGGDRALVAGRMRSLDLLSNPPVAGTDRDVMAARIELESGIFTDGFESGTTGAWSAVMP